MAVETPDADLGFYGLMALIGIYVGVIPVAIGMLWLPWVRSVDARWIRFLLAFTVGLLAFLGIDALLEGTELAGAGPEALGGGRSSGSGRWAPTWCCPASTAGCAGAARSASRDPTRTRGGPVHVARREASAWRAAFLVALGIGLHNLGEGLAIGSAYAVGSLALGAALVVGFALHNTTEGLAIVAPTAKRAALGRAAGAARPARRGARGARRLGRGVGLPSRAWRRSCSESAPAQSPR